MLGIFQFALLSGCTMASQAVPGVVPAKPGAAEAVPSAVSPLQPAVPERRLLSLEYPPAIRAGDSDRVILTLLADEQGNITPTAEFQGNVIQGQVINLPNAYDTYNVMAEARLDMVGMEVRPPDLVAETLLPGQKVTFFWSIRAQDVGNYKGTVWFYLRFIPKNGGQELHQALSAQFIEIDAVALLGLKAETARWLGLGGALFGTVLGFPFIEDALKWFWRRLRKPA